MHHAKKVPTSDGLDVIGRKALSSVWASAPLLLFGLGMLTTRNTVCARHAFDIGI